MVTMAPQKDADLQYWLANEDWYMSRYTRRWLARTPPRMAADVLAGIAGDAQAEPKAPLSRLFSIFAASGFATSGGSGESARKAGVRAALLLAGLGDARCIPALARVCDPYGFWRSKYQEEIEAALTRSLSDAADQADDAQYAADIRQMVERIYSPSHGKRTLSASVTNLQIAALRYLKAAAE